MLPEQHISAIIFEPSSQMLFAGSYNGKIFASGDWVRVGSKEIKGSSTRKSIPRQPIGRR
jgi:hypothetical protein